MLLDGVRIAGVFQSVRDFRARRAVVGDVRVLVHVALVSYVNACDGRAVVFRARLRRFPAQILVEMIVVFDVRRVHHHRFLSGHYVHGHLFHVVMVHVIDAFRHEYFDSKRTILRVKNNIHRGNFEKIQKKLTLTPNTNE